MPPFRSSCCIWFRRNWSRGRYIRCLFSQLLIPLDLTVPHCTYTNLFFQMKTKIQSCEGPTIPLYGLSLSNMVDVCSHTADYDYLVGKKIVVEYMFNSIEIEQCEFVIMHKLERCLIVDDVVTGTLLKYKWRFSFFIRIRNALKELRKKLRLAAFLCEEVGMVEDEDKQAFYHLINSLIGPIFLFFIFPSNLATFRRHYLSPCILQSKLHLPSCSLM